MSAKSTILRKPSSCWKRGKEGEEENVARRKMWRGERGGERGNKKAGEEEENRQFDKKPTLNS